MKNVLNFIPKKQLFLGNKVWNTTLYVSRYCRVAELDHDMLCQEIFGKGA